MDVIYDELEKIRAEDLRFQAGIHGIDLSSKKEKVEKSVDSDTPMFGSPDDYENLSPEKRQEMTEQMMSKHKSWAGQSSDLGVTHGTTS